MVTNYDHPHRSPHSRRILTPRSAVAGGGTRNAVPSPRAHSRRESTCCFQIAHLLLSITSSCRDSLGRKGRSFVCLYVRLPCKILFVFQRTPSSGECSSGLATRCSGGAPHKGKTRRERIRRKKRLLFAKVLSCFPIPHTDSSDCTPNRTHLRTYVAANADVNADHKNQPETHHIQINLSIGAKDVTIFFSLLLLLSYFLPLWGAVLYLEGRTPHVPHEW